MSVNDAQPARTTRGTLPILAALVLLAAAVAVVHWPALSAKTVSFDDDQYLIDNYLVRNPSLAHAARFLVEVLEPSTVGGYYQPLNMMSLMLDTALGASPDNLRPYHATSLALHVLNTLLLATILRLLFHSNLVAFAVALLFGLHPMTVETIPWIGERKTLLATCFAWLAILAYLRFTKSERRRLAYYLVCIGLFVLALLAKPTVTPLPIMLLLMDVWPLKRFGRRAVWEKSPMLAIAAASSVITFVSQARTASVVMPSDQSRLEGLYRVCHNVVFYPMKMLCPINLTSHNAVPQPLDFTQPMIAFGVFGTICVAALVLFSLRRTRAIAACSLVFYAGLLPTMQIFGFSNVIASDKYAYFPSVGLVMVLCAGLMAAMRRWGQRGAIVGAIVILFAAAGESLATRRYLAHWKDTETYYRYMITQTPQAWSLHSHLGNTLIKMGRIEEGLATLHTTLTYATDPITRSGVLVDIGNVHRANGELQSAMAVYQDAIRLYPGFHTAYLNLGVALAESGQAAEAVAMFETSIRLHTRNPQAHYSWATVLITQNKLDEAADHLRRAIALHPFYAEAHINLAIILDQQGRRDDALEHFLSAVRWKPENVEARFNLAQALIVRGRATEAVPHLREVLRLSPADPDAANLLEQITRASAPARSSP